MRRNLDGSATLTADELKLLGTAAHCAATGQRIRGANYSDAFDRAACAILAPDTDGTAEDIEPDDIDPSTVDRLFVD